MQSNIERFRYQVSYLKLSAEILARNECHAGKLFKKQFPTETQNICACKFSIRQLKK